MMIKIVCVSESACVCQCVFAALGTWFIHPIHAYLLVDVTPAH